MDSSEHSTKNKLTTALLSSQKIAIITHINPDADALCSAFALKNIIINNFDYKLIDVFTDGDISALYEPLVRNELINPIPYTSYDLAICLDCPTVDRMGKYKDLFTSVANSISIDHHGTNERFANTINYSTTKVSSTCELVYLISKKAQFEINNTIAKYLYQGIITDTNCFSSSTTTKLTHKVLNELLDFNFSADLIKKHYFKTNPLGKVKLQAAALKNIKTYHKNELAIMKISFSDLKKYCASFDDTLGLIDDGISIDGIKLCAIIIEKEPNSFHISLRSDGEINVGEIAKYFNGGGSNESSAFQFAGSLSEIENKLTNMLISVLNNSQSENETQKNK